MTYIDLLEEKGKECETIEDMTDFIDRFSDLYYEIEETEEGYILEVFCFDDCMGSEFIGRFYFDKQERILN